MKTITYVAAACLASAVAWAAPASAQDMGSMAPWSGFYIGGNAGWGGDPSSLHFVDLSEGHDLSFAGNNNGGSNFLGGVDGGYNWWMGNMMAGVEGDYDWGSHISHLASVRARLGFGGERWLFYGTAGVGFLGDDEKFTVNSTSSPSDSFSRSRDRTGFVGGIGTEYALSHNLGLGVDALWYDFGSDRTLLTTASDEDFGVRDNRNFGVVRARLTWYVNQ